ncbi:TPA: rhamnogalacturonan acetylesterase, partial [Enterococcus faecium]|nr:rhamnogalacturonan acetylesterase [Enterococcus faecium]
IFFECAKKANVQMVLLTSVTRRDYLENGTLNPDILGDYPKAMRAFAEKHHIPLLDVFSRSQELFQTFSKEETKKFYLHLMPDTCKNYPEGLKDNTHFSPEGADKVARIIVELIKESRLPLANYLQKGV